MLIVDMYEPSGHSYRSEPMSMECPHETGREGNPPEEARPRICRGLRKRSEDLPALRCVPIKLLYLAGRLPASVQRGPGPQEAIARSHPNQTPAEVVEKVLYLRQKYHLGPIRIVWYMRRYHDIRISDAGVYRILRRNGLSRLPRTAGTRAVHTKRYEKQVPGHHIQVDVKFLIFKGKGGGVIKRYQYTAIDDATRIRALKVYSRSTSSSSSSREKVAA